LARRGEGEKVKGRRQKKFLVVRSWQKAEAD
jgi:hypothetical protein